MDIVTLRGLDGHLDAEFRSRIGLGHALGEKFFSGRMRARLRIIRLEQWSRRFASDSQAVSRIRSRPGSLDQLLDAAQQHIPEGVRIIYPAGSERIEFLPAGPCGPLFAYDRAP